MRPDGQEIWIEARGEISQYEADGDTHFFGTSRNITDQKQAALDLNKSTIELRTEQRKLDAMIANATSGMTLMRGPTFVFEKVNAKWLELVGEREYIGKTWREAYPELRGSPLPEKLAHVFESGEPFHANEMLIKVDVGGGLFEERYYDFDYFRVLDGAGDPYGVFCQCLNVTKRVSD